jgi:hypothetical protein
MPEPKLYAFSTHIDAACNKQSRTFGDLAEKLKMDLVDLRRQCNAKAPPAKALVKGLVRELDISEPISTSWRKKCGRIWGAALLSDCGREREKGEYDRIINSAGRQ